VSTPSSCWVDGSAGPSDTNHAARIASKHTHTLPRTLTLTHSLTQTYMRTHTHTDKHKKTGGQAHSTWAHGFADARLKLRRALGPGDLCALQHRLNGRRRRGCGRDKTTTQPTRVRARLVHGHQWRIRGRVVDPRPAVDGQGQVGWWQ
jgi:hypothetical protein